MRRELAHVFVSSMPEELLEGILYISIEFCTAIHRCCCGCGSKVVTPMSPVGWTLMFDGDSVSLYPSIGNWSLPCRSHYWIENNSVRPARDWSESEVTRGRHRDVMDRERYFGRPRNAPLVGTGLRKPSDDDADEG
jgi:hypothetical protein